MSKNLYLCVPDPFDSSTGARLERMGILRPDGEVNVEVMRAFVQIFGGLFFDDLCDFYSDQGEVSAVTAAFSELAARKDCQNIYLLISLQYDTIRKPLPDPIWWLAGCAPALSLFCLGFVERLLELSENQASNGKEMVANETAEPAEGSVPLLEFFGLLDEKQRQKLLSLFALLLQSPAAVMREPYVKHFCIERYQALYELRAKSKNLVRIIFTLTDDGDILFLTPFIKRHKRNTMQALDRSLDCLTHIRDGSCSTQELSIKFFLNGGITV